MPRPARALLVATVLLGLIAPATASPRAARAAARLQDSTPVASPATTTVTPTATTTAAVTPTVTPTLAPDTDIWNLDTHTRHYTAGANGQTHLQLYNSPAGYPDGVEWTYRNPTLGANEATGVLSPARMPFGLAITTTASAPALATLTNEDGVTLGLGLGAINGALPGAVKGVANGNAVTYPAPVALYPSDLSLRATISGLNVGLTLHNANEARQVLLGLTPDPRARVMQEASGAIRVTRAITSYGDGTVTGTAPLVMDQPEFIAALPVARDSNPDPAAALGGPASPMTMTLVTPVAGSPQIALTLDPTWLADPARVYPVRVDLPIQTAESAADTGLFGTVSSCAPNRPAPQTAVVVGVENGCTYHGLAFFDLSALRRDTPVVTTTLRLYTPNMTGPTGVLVYPNAPVADVPGALASHIPSWQPPSWNTTPAITGAVAITEGAISGDGHWHSWDITSLVRGWVADGTTNAGVTLVYSGTPVLFASPLGAGSTRFGGSSPITMVKGFSAVRVGSMRVATRPRAAPHVRVPTSGTGLDSAAPTARAGAALFGVPLRLGSSASGSAAPGATDAPTASASPTSTDVPSGTTGTPPVPSPVVSPQDTSVVVLPPAATATPLLSGDDTPPAPPPGLGPPGPGQTPAATPTPGVGAAVTATTVVTPYGQLGLSFERNVGQTDARVSYLSRGAGYTLWLAGGEAVMALIQSPAVTPMLGPGGKRDLIGSDVLSRTTPLTTSVVRMRFPGANLASHIVGLDQLPGKVNYLTGDDSHKWRTDVPTYGRVAYQGVYPGVDLVYHGTPGRLEYDWDVAPGADPRAIALALDGATGLDLDKQGNLNLRTESGTLVQPSPS